MPLLVVVDVVVTAATTADEPLMRSDGSSSDIRNIAACCFGIGAVGSARSSRQLVIGTPCNKILPDFDFSDIVMVKIQDIIVIVVLPPLFRIIVYEYLLLRETLATSLFPPNSLLPRVPETIICNLRQRSELRRHDQQSNSSDEARIC